MPSTASFAAAVTPRTTGEKARAGSRLPTVLARVMGMLARPPSQSSL
jgi:hypothetical protein